MGRARRVDLSVPSRLLLFLVHAAHAASFPEGLEVRNVGGGMHGVVATRSFRAEQMVYSIQRATLFSNVFESMETFEAAVRSGDARDLLEHSVPGVSGRVFLFSDAALPCYENHSAEPNISGMHWSWLDSSEAVLVKRALRDIAEGDEVCVDYNGCSGYGVRDDEPMRRFLAMRCATSLGWSSDRGSERARGRAVGGQNRRSA